MLKANINYIKFNKINNTNNLLDNSIFTLKKNFIYTITGKNGSGKSTLLFALMNFLDSSLFEVKAKVIINSTDLYSLVGTELKKFRANNFRFVFQDPLSAFDPLKKMDYYFNLLKSSNEEIALELKYFQLPEYEKIKNLYPYQLSTGMLQRIALTLAIIAKPPILLLDEPSSALDLPIVNLLCNRLKRYVDEENGTVLLVTQDFPFAKNVSDFTAELKDGKLSPFTTN